MVSGYQAKLRHAYYYWSVARAANEMYRQGGDNAQRGLTLFEAEWANIQAGQAWVSNSASCGVAEAEMCSFYADACPHLLELRQHSRVWMKWLEDAIDGAKHLGLRGMLASHTGNMGITYSNLGDTTHAVRYFRKHLALSRQNGNRSGQQSAISNLGIMYRNRGAVRRAIRFFEKSLAMALELGDKIGEGNAFGNLGTAYAVVREVQLALDYHQRASLLLRNKETCDG
jgi:tetratricopeptide (TPR) repeat protein